MRACEPARHTAAPRRPDQLAPHLFNTLDEIEQVIATLP
jgi:hypothetical protein